MFLILKTDNYIYLYTLNLNLKFWAINLSFLWDQFCRSLRPDDDLVQAVVAKFDDTTGFLFTGSQKSDVDQEPATSSASSAFPKETVSGGTDEMLPDVDDSVPKLKKKEKKASKPEKQAKLDKKKVKKHQKKKGS